MKQKNRRYTDYEENTTLIRYLYSCSKVNE